MDFSIDSLDVPLRRTPIFESTTILPPQKPALSSPPKYPPLSLVEGKSGEVVSTLGLQETSECDDFFKLDSQNLSLNMIPQLEQLNISVCSEETEATTSYPHKVTTIDSVSLVTANVGSTPLQNIGIGSSRRLPQTVGSLACTSPKRPEVDICEDSLNVSGDLKGRAFVPSLECVQNTEREFVDSDSVTSTIHTRDHHPSPVLADQDLESPVFNPELISLPVGPSPVVKSRVDPHTQNFEEIVPSISPILIADDSKSQSKASPSKVDRSGKYGLKFVQ